MPDYPGQTGAGTTLAYALKSAPTTFLPIGTIQDLDGPAVTVGEVENKKLSSTFKPYAATTPEGTASFTVQHLSYDAAVIALRGAVNTRPVPTFVWKVTYPDGGTDVFDGFPKGYSISGVENETIIVADIEIRILTSPFITPGTAPA